MKKLMTIVYAAMMACLVGCKTIPTVDSMTTTSTAIGYAAGVVATQTSINDKSRLVVIDIVNKVCETIPASNQTFETVWMPIAKEHVQTLVDESKIDAVQGQLIIGAFKTACDGIDYLFEVRYPKAKEYQELVSAAVHGFSNGFLTTFAPVNALSAQKIEYDVDAYNYLTSRK